MRGTRVKRSKWTAGILAAVLAVGCVIPGAGALPSEETRTPDDPNRFTVAGVEDVFAPVLDNGDAGDHTHGSGIAVLPSGELLCVWFQGNGERDATTTRIMGSRKPVGEDWTEPFVMADAPGVADINPAIYVDNSGRLWMFWYPVLSAIWETSQPRFAYAEPGSYEYENVGNQAPDWTWSDNIPIKIGENTGGVVDPESDQFVADVKAGYQELIDYTYGEVNLPENPSDVYHYDDVADAIISIYEDGNTGGGVNQAVRGSELQDNLADILKKIGGDPDEQSFTPTVADKVGPTSDGTVQRSGYPLLRRIGWQTKNAPLEIQLPEGVMTSYDELSTGTEHRLIVPLYSDGLGISINAITDDGGKTWMMSKPIIGNSTIQASMAQRDNGDIVALMRNNGPVPYRAAYSISEDYGMTWSVAQLRADLFEPGVGNCLTELPNGNWVFVSNCQDNERRSVLSVALSEDEGKTWPYRRTIEMDTRDGNGKYHYPAVVADENNQIHITYTIDYGGDDAGLQGHNNIRYLKIDENWIKEGDWSDSNTQNKMVFCYEYSAIDMTLPEGFDTTNVDADGTYAAEEIAKLAQAMPKTLKAYLSFNNHDGDGLYLAAPGYVEVNVQVDQQWLKENFKVGEVMEDVPFTVDTDTLPEGITEDMLPQYDPMYSKILVTES